MAHCNDCQPLTTVTYPKNSCPDPCDPCGEKTPTSCVLYGGEPLPCINVPKGTTLDIILQNINNVICQLQACCSTTTTSTSSTTTTTTTTVPQNCFCYTITNVTFEQPINVAYIPCGSTEVSFVQAFLDIPVSVCAVENSIGPGSFILTGGTVPCSVDGDCVPTTTTTTTACPCNNYEFTGIKGVGSATFTFIACGDSVPTTLDPFDTPVVYCVDNAYPIIQIGTGSYTKQNCCSTTTTTTTQCPCTLHDFYENPATQGEEFVFVECGARITTKLINVGPDPVTYCVDRTYPIISYGGGSYIDTGVCCAPPTTTTTTTAAPVCTNYIVYATGVPASWNGLDCNNNPVGGFISLASPGVPTGCIFSNTLVLNNAAILSSSVCP